MVRGLTRRQVVAALAAGLFAAITTFRFSAGDVDAGYTLLYALPIALLAIEFGLVAGLLGATMALAVVVTWDQVRDADLTFAGYLTRGLAFYLLGGLVGFELTQRRRLERVNTRWFELSNDLVSEVSLEGRLSRINGAWTELLGHEPEALRGRRLGDLVHSDDRAATERTIHRLAAGPAQVTGFECRIAAADGTWHWLLWSARSDGHRIYAAAKDITERKALEGERERLRERLSALARTDELTELPNRRAWDEALRGERERARRDGSSFAVAMLDLDRFKQFNDRHGHPAGDDLLRDAARAWRPRLRTVDTLARYGGEEFAVLLPDCPPGDSAAVVERVRAATPRDQTVSAGIAMWDGEEDVDALVRRADRALYEAKRAGRDRSVLAGGGDRQGV